MSGRVRQRRRQGRSRGIWSRANKMDMSLPVLKKSKHLLMESRQTLQFHWKPDRAWEEKREVVGKMTENQINILVNTTLQVFRVVSSGTFQGGIAQRLSLYTFYNPLYCYVHYKGKTRDESVKVRFCSNICSETGPVNDISAISQGSRVPCWEVESFSTETSIKEFPSRFTQSKAGF